MTYPVSLRDNRESISYLHVLGLFPVGTPSSLMIISRGNHNPVNAADLPSLPEESSRIIIGMIKI